MSIANNIDKLQQQIRRTIEEAGRPLSSVQVLAVSKDQPCHKLLEAYSAGLREFGENYVQEAQDKMQQLSHLPLVWHFIGHIQSNKAKIIAQNFSWVQSVDRVLIAEKLNAYRPKHLPKLNICIQVNVDAEMTKSGVSPNHLIELAECIMQQPQLCLRGLMCIPAPTDNLEKQRATFLYFKDLFIMLQARLSNSLDTLSMGMSDDFISAIQSGSTMLRIGRRIFGARP